MTAQPTREKVEWAKRHAAHIQNFAMRTDSEASAIILAHALASAERDAAAYHQLISRIAKQRPAKPDHWTSCSQCEDNIDAAKDAIDAAQRKDGAT